MSKEIEIKIEKFEKMIAHPSSSAEEKEMYKESVEKLKSQLSSGAGEKSAPANKKKPAPAKEKKPAPAPAPSKKKKGVKMISSKTVSIDGKEVSMDSQEFCDYLLKQFKDRRDKSKSTGAKKKTTSVMSRVSSNIEKGVAQAIKAGEKDKKAQINKDPKPFIKKIEKLETSTKSFLQDLKDVMGGEYDSSEVSSTVKSINSMIEELKKKMNEKK